jgi:hypothetical protein
MDGQTALLWAQVATAAATAIATIGLVVFTWLLAERSSQPHVVATLEANQWSIIHVDLVLANTGNAPAYDIKLAFDPPLTSDRIEKRNKGMPFADVTVLKPGQSFSSFVGDYKAFKETEYTIKITWRRKPNGWRSEVNEYKFCIDQFAGVTRLGELNPSIQIANEVKKIREEWGRIASGFKKLNVNVFTADDRAEERREDEEFYNRIREEESDQSSAGNSSQKD